MPRDLVLGMLEVDGTVGRISAILDCISGGRMKASDDLAASLMNVTVGEASNGPNKISMEG